LIVDDHAMFRHSLAFLLSSMRPDATIDQTANIEQALSLIQSLDRFPDLAVLDLHVPNAEPLAGLMLFRERLPEVPVVVVSADDHSATIHACIELGAFSFVPKSAGVEELTLAIDRILGGGVWIPRSMHGTPAPVHSQPGSQGPLSRDSLVAPLTPRQTDVLQRVIQGKTNKVIGKELGISDGTVKTHLAHLMGVFAVNTRTQLVFEMARLGIRIEDERQPRSL
jgi:two-component system, NarL family, nitrate/nitrite response regulator NarL